METLQGLEREVARLQAEVLIIKKCAQTFSFLGNLSLFSGGPAEKGGGGGEKEELKPRGAL